MSFHTDTRTGEVFAHHRALDSSRNVWIAFPACVSKHLQRTDSYQSQSSLAIEEASAAIDLPEWSFWQGQVRLHGLIWLSIVTAFYGLWKGRSHAALMLRLILLVSFSAIMVGALIFSYWWVISQTTLSLVLFLSAIGALNIVFYTRRVRLTALKNNLLEPPEAV